MTIPPRFWSKVNKEPGDGCWVWTGCLVRGYGMMHITGKGAGYAHRFAWESLVGPIPHGMQLDHICHNPTCVNPAHLRLATQAENARNRLRSRNNASKFKGVGWHRSTGKWRARIGFGRKKYYLGLFDSPEDAYFAYCSAATRLHGEFANIGDAPKWNKPDAAQRQDTMPSEVESGS